MSRWVDSSQRDNEITCPTMPFCSVQKYVFTLVHGTWGRSWPFRFLAKISGSRLWFEEGSAFQTALKARLPGAAMFTFNWSGSNSHSARQDAGRALAERLEKCCAEHADARHFIIAHSHGGNVACYALRDNDKLRSQISGVICLATPFVDVRPRHLGFIEKMSWIVINFIAFALACLGIGMQLVYILGITEVWAPYVIGIPSFLCFAGAIWLVSTFESRCMTIAKEMALPYKVLPALLLVRTAADEASIMLVMCQVGSWLLRRITDLIVLPVLIAERLVKWLGLTIASTIGFLTFVSIGGIPLMLLEEKYGRNLLIQQIGTWTVVALAFVFRKFIKRVGPYTVSLWLLSIYVIFLLPLAYMSIGSLTSLERYDYYWYAAYILPFVVCGGGCIFSTLVLGARFAPAYIYLDIAIEASPPGDHLISQFALEGDVKERARILLNHSISYQKPEVVERLSKWVESASKPALADAT